MNIKDSKANIRKEICKRRMDIPSHILSEIDSSLPEFIAAIEDEDLTKALGKAKRIALYRSFNGEVPVDGLAQFFMNKGIICCFPRIVNGNMIFCDCDTLSDDEFEISSYGIKEPVVSKPAVDPEDIDIVVLPAVAYNEEGTRLGMGGGFYDRFIGAFDSAGPYLLGICYEFQICSEVPTESQDITADFIAVIPEEIYGNNN